MDFEAIPWPVLVVTVLALVGQVAVYLAVVIVAVKHLDETRATWTPGLWLAGLVVLLALPNRIVGAMFVDMGAILPMLPSPDGGPIEALLVSLPQLAVGVLVSLGLVGFFYAVTLRLDSGQSHAFPWLTRQPQPTRGWGIALALGIGGGLLSTAAFRLMDIEVGELMEFAENLTPGLDREAWWFNWLVVLPWTLSAAIEEELMFRGVVQRFLARWFGRGEAGAWVAIVLTSLFWAALHAPNTTDMGFKLVQIFLLGLVFGALARKRGVEASIVAHMALNFSATALELAL